MSCRPDPLPYLDRFLSDAMPSLMRRLRSWKGLHPDHHHDILEDLHQELVLDCLQNAAEIASLSTRERHGRWFRLIESRHYDLRVRAQRRVDPARSPDEVSSPQPWMPLEDILPPTQAHWTRELATHGVRLKNGRLNATDTARRLGLHPRQLRDLWTRLADALGYDQEFVAFWRRRLVEALVGLAADQLRDAELVFTHDECGRVRPDPSGRMRRIRRIKRELERRPLTGRLREVLVRLTRRGAARVPSPREALDAACELAPDDVSVHLWRFELAVVEGRLRDAACALRTARAYGAPRYPSCWRAPACSRPPGASRRGGACCAARRAAIAAIAASRSVCAAWRPRPGPGGCPANDRLSARPTRPVRAIRAPAKDRPGPSSTAARRGRRIPDNASRPRH